MPDLLKQVVQPLDQSIRYIPLTQGKVAVVDAADYPRINQWNWHAQFLKKSGRWRALRRFWDPDGKCATVFMHREIMGAPAGVEVDHFDGDGLNNRRSTNLRLAAHAENGRNRGLQRNNKSGFKGVSWKNKIQRWQVQIKFNSKYIYLGVFTDKLEAAKAYADAAKRLHGEFARTTW